MTVSGSGKVKVRVVAAGKGVFLDKIVLRRNGTGRRRRRSPYATGALSQVDTTAAGAGANGSSVNSASVSPDGRYVAFLSDATNLVPEATDGLTHLYVKTLATGAIRAVDKSASGVLGNDGGFVAGSRVLGWKPTGHELLFTTYATNLIDTVTPRWLGCAVPDGQGHRRQLGGLHRLRGHRRVLGAERGLDRVLLQVRERV